MITTVSASRRAPRVVRGMLMTLLVAALAIGGLAVYRSASAATPGSDLAPVPQHDAAVAADGVVTAEDGLLPDGASAFDENLPGVAGLAPALREALQRASHDAAAADIEVQVNSGWRSPEYQDLLLREAQTQYGSAEEAARWVASAATSSHVSGDAVDVGSYDAVEWLAERGAAYGLCQMYANEPWHFELRPQAIDQGCPPPYADPTQDPRMG